MSSNPNQHEPHPIPFGTTPIDQQQNSIIPSMDRFPSTSQFNQALPQYQSVASVNYNDQANPLPLQTSQKDIQNKQSEQQQQELQKVSLNKNQIDQDEILRMFRQEDNKGSRNKNNLDKRKSHTSSSGITSTMNKDKKQNNHTHSHKKQHQSGQDASFHRRRQQTDEQSLPFIAKTSSFKDVKYSTNYNYTNIASSDKIHQLLIQYKIQYRSSVYDPDWQKQRYKLKQQLFEQLCIGIQEMRQKSQSQLTKDQNQVLQKVKQIALSINKLPYDFGVFKYCRNIVIQLDLDLFLHFHQRSKQPLSKDYKSQYKLLLTNLKDPQNYELRRKILTGQMDAQSIKIVTQIQLLTEAKRVEIKQKQKKLLKQFSVDHERTMLKPEFEQEKQQQRITENIKYDSNQAGQLKEAFMLSQSQIPQVNQSSLQPVQQSQVQNESFSLSNLLSANKYLQQATLSQLEQLLSQNQIQRMRTRLDEDLRGDCRQKMLTRFDTLTIENI